jgi:hypothetical protein
MASPRSPYGRTEASADTRAILRAVEASNVTSWAPTLESVRKCGFFLNENSRLQTRQTSRFGLSWDAPNPRPSLASPLPHPLARWGYLSPCKPYPLQGCREQMGFQRGQTAEGRMTEVSQQTAAQKLLDRRRIRSSLAEWSRHNGFEPARHHLLMLEHLERISRGEG